MGELNVPSGSAETAGEPPEIPGHRLVRRIGRGSYGEVWLAESAGGEYRAVKVVHRHTFERERPFEREFSGIQKFEPVSRTHQSQVKILEVGRNEEAGFFYYAMELADDAESGREIDPGKYKPKTLRSEVAAVGRIPYDRALDISLSLTKALEHLHQHGLIHRDIKPSNIIFVDGVPKLADIGLVTDVGASISYVGTEGFLPPEGPVSQQADLYSLGKVLYEMSTGQDRMDFPELPTFLGDPEEKQGLLELNLVFLKACQNDPQKRYGSAQEMHGDLAILRGGKSLKRTRALERRLAHITRTFGLTAAAALVGVVGYYAWNQHRLKRLEEEVARREREKQIAQDAARNTERQLVDLYLSVGEGLRKEGEVRGALAWYARALAEDTDEARLEEHRQRIQARLAGMPKLVGFLASPGEVSSVTLNGNAMRVVAAGGELVSIWDAVTGLAAAKPLRHKSRVHHAELSPDGQRLLSLCQDGSAWLWRLGDETVAFELVDRAAIRAGALSPDGRFAVTWGNNNQVVVWDGLGGRGRLRLDHEAMPVAASYSPNGRHIGVLAAEKLYVWDAERGEKLLATRCPERSPEQLVFSADSRKILVLSGPTAHLCDVGSGEWSIISLRESAKITCGQFAPDGRTIVTGTADGVVRRWETVTGKAAKMWRVRAPLTELAVSADGTMLVCASDDHAWVVEVQEEEMAALPGSGRGGMRRVAWSADARRVVTATADGAIWISELLPSPDAPAMRAPSRREELIGITRVVSGQEVNDHEQLAGIKPETLHKLWLQLKTNETFATMAPSEWHGRRAERLSAAGAWFGVRFHVERLSKMAPLDERVQAWRARAEAELARLDAPVVASARIPPRATEATDNLVDLTEFYNAGLAGTWLPTNQVGRSNDLAQLAGGVHKFNGVWFDVRGVIQLSGTALENQGGQFPTSVRGIPIKRKATHLHFLHGTAWQALYGTVIGKYVIHYRSGATLEAKIVFGQNVRDWWFPPTQSQTTLEAAVAWQGYSPASREMGMALRIYQYKWKNPLPEDEIETVDFVTAMEKPAPFLLAITTELAARR